MEELLDAGARDSVDSVEDQSVQWVGLASEVGQASIGDLLAVGDVQEVKLAELRDVAHHFISDSICAARELDLRKLGILVQKKATCCRQKAQTVSYVDALKLGQVLEDLGEDGVGDELHAAQGQDHEVGRHAADVADHVVLDPVVVLEVEAQGLLAQELAKVLFVQDSARHTFQILNLLPV